MRFRQFRPIYEAVTTTITADHLTGLKDLIATKIKQLPDDETTAKTLKEIEELLTHLGQGGVGGRFGLIGKEIDQIRDETVRDAKKVLARFILSIEATPEQRKEFFDLWKADEIVNIQTLLSGEDVGFEDVFTTYGTNPLTTEFVDEVMMVSELGIGKGEFGLNVLSKSIATSQASVKAEDKEELTGEGAKKGDLVIKLGNKVLHVECKTEQGGAARFSDQEVKPAEGYEAVARKLIDFVSKSKTYPMNVPGYGLNLSAGIEFYQNTDAAERKKFLDITRDCLQHIFHTDKSVKPKQQIAIKGNIDAILGAISVGDEGTAKQQYGQATFNYYIGKKEDDGVLNTNLNTKRFVYYNDAAALESQGLRLHIKTAYIASTKDIARSVYPQVSIIPTTYGGEEATSQLRKVNTGKEPWTTPEFDEKVNGIATVLCRRRQVTDPAVIEQIRQYIVQLIIARTPTQEIIPELEDRFPQIRKKTKSKPAPKKAVAKPAPAAPRQAPAAQPAPAAQAPQPATAMPATMVQPTAFN